RSSLSETDLGRIQYLQEHIPGAVYAHVEEDLSGPVVAGVTGRHPLPAQEEINALFSSWGIDRATQVVAYDDRDGSFAARLWWLLRWQGHEEAAVLDGGWQAWKQSGLPTKSGEEIRHRGHFKGNPDLAMVAGAEEIQSSIPNRDLVLIDARAPERFRGEIEPIDPVAGRIPGSVNSYHNDTVDERGRFLPAEVLRRRFEKTLDGRPAGEAVVYCGSGVTAAQVLLAFDVAGLKGARLYPGSWSEWITDTERPIAAGDDRKATEASDGR
ncbi:MAG TPA: sulfurtransferase, partial [Anaerolineales bacterium]|nr:sulfurtransferase [Anaerolineales bacterium]